MQSVASAAAAEGANLGSDANSKWIRDYYAMGKPPEGGDERMKGFAAQLSLRDPKAAERWERMSKVSQIAYMAKEEARAGITGGGSIGARYGVPDKMMGVLANIHGKGYTSIGEENTAFAKAFGYEGTTGIDGYGGLLNKAKDMVSGTAAHINMKGEFIKSAEFRDLAENLLSEDRSVAEKAHDALSAQLGSIAKGGRTDADDVKEKMLSASGFASLLNSNASQKELEHYAKEHNTTVDALRDNIGGMSAIVSDRQRIDRRAAAAEFGEAGRKSRDSSIRAGIYDARTESLTAATHDKLMEKGGAAAVAIAMSGITQTALQAKLQGGEGDDAANADIMEKLQAGGSKQAELFHTATVEQLKAVAEGMIGTEVGGKAARAGAIQKGLIKGNKNNRANSTLAGFLGVGTGKGDITTEEGAASLAEQYAQSTGVKQDDTINMIRKAVDAARTGDVKGEREAIQGITEGKDYQDSQKEKRASADEEQNPTLAAMKKNSEQANKYLEAIVKATAGGTAALLEINTKTTAADPERNSSGGATFHNNPAATGSRR